MVVLHRERCVPELRHRVHVRPPALRDRDRAEMILGGAIRVHVPAGDHRVEGVHPELSVGAVEAAGEGVRGRRSRTRAAVAALVRRLQRAIGEHAGDGRAHAAGDRERRVLDHRGSGRAAEIHRRGEPEIAKTEGLLQHERAHRRVAPRESRVHQQAVEVRAPHAGVLEGESHGFDGESDVRTIVHSSLRGDAEAGNRDLPSARHVVFVGETSTRVNAGCRPSRTAPDAGPDAVCPSRFARSTDAKDAAASRRRARAVVTARSTTHRR